MNWERAKIVDYTLPVYTGQLMALVPINVPDKRDARIEPFDWRVWVVIAFLPQIYLLMMAIAECLFNHDINWWILIEVTLRPIFMQGVPRPPVANTYNRIFSITWITMCYVLAVAYLGMSHDWLCWH